MSKFKISLLIASQILVFSQPTLAQTGNCSNQPNIVCNSSEKLPILNFSSASGNFSAKIIFLADQIERNLNYKGEKTTYLVSSFANLNNLSETNALGRLISESLMHELQVRAWNIYEARLMQNFMINSNGEFTLSRETKNLRDSYGVTGVVAGTVLTAGNTLIINARVIDTASGLVVSSGQIQLPLNSFTNNLANNHIDVTRPMRIVGNSE
jgi:TolB-like protein